MRLSYLPIKRLFLRKYEDRVVTAIRNARKAEIEFDVSDAELDQAFEEARTHVMSREEREAQLISFVWGNAPEGNRGTIEQVRTSLKLSIAS